MASSSSATDSCNQYDVFLSFRGIDTRNNFISHLHHALPQAQIKAFIDYEIDRGEEITPFLERVIECAKISIIVFSPEYASSTYCLDELFKIMESRELKAQFVLPIFYKVDPSEEIYVEAFARHKVNLKGIKRYREETIEQEKKKVKKWKSAFGEALELAGWHIDKNSNEAEIIGEITSEVLEKLKSCQSRREELKGTSIVSRKGAFSILDILDNMKELLLLICFFNFLLIYFNNYR